ncbi:MAG TPA: hypothetical protein VD766_01380 [Solirubrobacterales bacterium]|nr:hypothetical protein [Solirubrobacterales bacterium]
MDASPRTNRTGLAAGIIGVFIVLAVLAVVFDLGPFADDDLSVAEFIAQGDDVCAQAHDEFLEVQGSTPRTAADAEEQVQALIEVAEKERDSLEELGAPSELGEDLSSYLASRERGIGILQDGLEAARDDDAVAYEDAQAELASEQAKRERIAQEIGFNECSEPLVSDDELERQAQPPDPAG